MDANVEKLDDLIVCLVGMGFDLEDCQQAVQVGKLSVEAAVEWILAGKPAGAPTAQGSTLKLTQRTPASIGANPFTGEAATSLPAVVNQQQTESGVSQNDEKAITSEDDGGVISRCHMNEEQRRIKERFIEKQREEARKSAQHDKLAQKKARELALKQIKEDRERQKMKSAVTQQSPPSAVSPQKPAASTPATALSPPDQNKKLTTMIQVRLPNGKGIKKSFMTASPFSEVWSWVNENHKETTGMMLMQPFPHKNFSDADRESSLADLGLTPSGSLVLKKQECSANPAGSVADAPSDDREDEPLVSIDTWQDNPPEHQWGSGIPLTAGEQPGNMEQPENMEQQENVEQHQNMEVDEDSGEDEAAEMEMFQNPGAWQGPVAPPWFNQDVPHQQGPNLPPWQVGPDQGQGWGFGQRLDGGWNPEPQVHQAVNPKQLAAEAAKKRHVDLAEVEVHHDEAQQQFQATFQRIPRLTDLIVENITSRICDSRHPVHNLYGLSAHHTSLILNNLIQSGKLNAKTLQPFISSNLTKLVLDSYPYATNDLLSIIRLLKMLTHLSLANCPLITDKGLLLLTPLRRLKYLSLMGCKQVTDKVFSLLKDLAGVITVNLEGTGITDEGVISYCTTEPPPDKLESLDLNRTQVTHNILSALQKIPNLKTLCLERTNVISLAGISALTRIECLNLANTMLVTDSLLCLKDHPSIRKLNISNTPQINGDLALQYLQGLHLQFFQLPDRLSTSSQGLQYIKDMPLIELDLTNYINVDDAGMEHISKIHTLKRLRLSNTRVTDVGLLLIQGLSNLEELLLQRTAVTDKGISVICGQNFPNLRELNLSQTLISNDCLLIGSLNSCTQLAKLNLSDTAVSNKGVRMLSLPYLELLNLDRTMIGPQFVLDLQTNVRSAMPRCPRLLKVSCNKTRALTDSEAEDI